VSALPDQVLKAVQRHRLFRHAQSILVAVSGGLDSMVLLRFLSDASTIKGWRLTVAHFNHQLRGRSSLADERLVRRTAKELGLPLVLDRADVRGYARSEGLSLEMAARELRHAFLAQTARRLGIRAIALGHHANDQVELFFLRVLRGSGGEGLAGMKWLSRSALEPKLELVRPLLGHRKSELRQYAIEQGIRFREDESNACVDLLRNRIRHELIPLLKRRYQAGVEGPILRAMEIVGSEAQFASDSAREWLKEVRSRKSARNNGVTRRFETVPVAVQRRCLQLQLFKKGIEPDFDLIECLRADRVICVNRKRTRRHPALAQELSPEGKTGEPGPLQVFRDESGVVQLRKIGRVNFRQGGLKVDIGQTTGMACFDGVWFKWRTLRGDSMIPPKRLSGKELFDADKLGSVVRLRHWRPGDRFQPIGMRSAVKLQDLFTNAKVPRGRRRELILATTGQGEIFWVEGLRMAEQFKLTQGTIRRLQWSWRRL